VAAQRVRGGKKTKAPTATLPGLSAFKKITTCRASGFLGDLTTRDIDRERDVLDEDRRGKAPAPLPIGPLFEAA
jgi:hypothetical protein